MTDVSIHPSTLDGIKRLAKSLKREQRISHGQALSEAARAAGFENFNHARRQLAGRARSVTSARLHDLYVTAYWRDGGASGRETLKVQLPASLDAMISPSLARHFPQHFRIDAADHLETRMDIRDQRTARDLVNATVRRLAFMAATGLRPATTTQARAIGRAMGQLPRKDHQSCWAWPWDKEAVCVDEPYVSVPSVLLEERRAYLRERGLFIALPRWTGLYSPGHARMYVIAGDERRLAQIVRAIESITLCPRDGEWAGESVPYAPTFVSPARAASGKMKRARPVPIKSGVARNGAVPFHAMPWSGVDWRPERRMSLAKHHEVGRILSSLLELEGLGSTNRETLEVTRCRLDDWLQREFSRKALPDDQFNAVYYGSRKEVAALPEGVTPAACVSRVIEILRGGYADCVPVRKLIRPLESLLRRFKSKDWSRRAPAVAAPIIRR